MTFKLLDAGFTVGAGVWGVKALAGLIEKGGAAVAARFAASQAVEKEGAKLGGELVEAATKNTDDLVSVFRGVPTDHYNSRIWADALKGKALPIGGHSNPAYHAAGNTRSVFTSWTTEFEVTQYFATGQGRGVAGVVLHEKLPRSVVEKLINPSSIPGEFELLRGAVHNAKVIHVSP